MKIKLLFIIIIFSVSGFARAQNLNFKRYSDNTNGFNGVSAALYIDNLEKYNLKEELKLETFEINELVIEFIEEFFENIFPSKGKKIDKLSSNNYWLCRQALNEFNTKGGEIYLIFCAENMSPENFVVIMAIIENDGKSFAWWGKTMLTNELE